MRTLCDVCESAAAILFCAADEAALCRSCDDKIPVSSCRVRLTNLKSNKEESTKRLFTKFPVAVCIPCYASFVVCPGPFPRPICCTTEVHMCNKLASRHVRVGLAAPSDVPRCDICENAPAFFYCEIDGSSLCPQCDMIVHVGGKRTHGRYLLLRQRVEFPGDKPGNLENLGQQHIDRNEIRREQNQPPKNVMRENQQIHRVTSIPVVDNDVDGDGKMDSKLIDLNANPQRIHGQNSTNQEQGVDVMSGTKPESASLVPDGSYKNEPEK